MGPPQCSASSSAVKRWALRLSCDRIAPHDFRDFDMTLSTPTSAKGVGASLRRKEDARYLAGRGQFVGDIRRAGMLEVAFVRSPVAHARIGSIRKPEGLEDRVWVMDDLTGVK